MAGTQRSNRPQVIEDLDAMITSRALKPGKVRLGGRLWTMKRDFTAEQVLKFHMLIDQRKNVEAFTMLVGGKDAPDFVAMVDAPPVELITPVLRRIYQLAGLLKRVEAAPGDDTPEPDTDADGDVEAEDAGEGESSAS